MMVHSAFPNAIPRCGSLVPSAGGCCPCSPHSSIASSLMKSAVALCAALLCASVDAFVLPRAGISLSTMRCEAARTQTPVAMARAPPAKAAKKAVKKAVVAKKAPAKKAPPKKVVKKPVKKVRAALDRRTACVMKLTRFYAPCTCDTPVCCG